MTEGRRDRLSRLICVESEPFSSSNTVEGFCEIQIQAWTVNLGPWTTFRRPRPRLTWTVDRALDEHAAG